MNETTPWLSLRDAKSLNMSSSFARCTMENPLTAREQQVVRAIVFGAKSTEAGVLLGIRRSTVETHLERTYRKLGIHSRRELAGQALRLGIV